MPYDRREAELLKRLASFRAAGELEQRYHNLGIGAVAAAAAHMSGRQVRGAGTREADPSWDRSAALPIT